MYFVLQFGQYNSCYFDIFTLGWYIHVQILKILSLMLWNHGLEYLKFKYFMYF